MSRPRLYVDEDAADRIVVDGLRAAGFDVLTTIDADLSGADDRTQLERAIADGRTFYSLNVADFARFHRDFLSAGRSHFGIILIPRQRYGASEKLKRLKAALEDATAEELCDKLIFV